MGRISISLPDDLEKRVNYFLLKNKSFDGVSDFYQELTNDFLNPGNKYYMSLAMLYIGYPFIILTILLKVASETHNIFYNYVISLILGLLLAGLYLMVHKHRGKK